VPAEATPAATATPEPTATAAPEATPTGAPTPVPGKLNISVIPWGSVSIDGKEMGLSPLSGVSLEPGKHRVVITHPEYQAFPRWVTIVAGKTGKMSVDLPREGIRR
jgi:hypothetical protein